MERGSEATMLDGGIKLFLYSERRLVLLTIRRLTPFTLSHMDHNVDHTFL